VLIKRGNPYNQQQQQKSPNKISAMKLAILIALLAGLGPMVQATNHMRRAAETLGDGTVERPSIRMYNATPIPL
jgi:hypothetical protein